MNWYAIWLYAALALQVIAAGLAIAAGPGRLRVALAALTMLENVAFVAWFGRDCGGELDCHVGAVIAGGVVGPALLLLAIGVGMRAAILRVRTAVKERAIPPRSGRSFHR